MTQQTEPDKHLRRREEMMDFVDYRKKFEGNFIKELKSNISLGRTDKVVITPSGSVQVFSNRGEGLSEREIIYDIVASDMTELSERLSKTASFYINKYEKINRVVKGMSMIVNRSVVMKDLWTVESKYQMEKLKYVL